MNRNILDDIGDALLNIVEAIVLFCLISIVIVLSILYIF